jgi:hypothetical protein
VTFVVESLFLSYEKYTWWIDSSATIHVANSLHGFISRTLRSGEISIKLANDVEPEVEAIGELPLEWNNDFILHLHNVLYVTSLSRNLISISCPDDDGFDYQFDNKQFLFYLIRNVLVLPFDKTSFLCYPCMRM